MLITLGLAGSAASAFGCLRALPLAGPRLPVLPAALGGALFGFSPAMTAQALGHPNLVFNLLMPVLVLLSLRLMLAERPARRDAVLLGIAAGVQVLIGEEALFLTGVVVALLLLMLALGDRCGRPPALARRSRVERRSRWARSCWSPASPWGTSWLGPLPQRGSPFDTAYYSVDLANYVLPNQLQALGPSGTVRPFPGGLEEHTAYLGWPLLLFALAGLVVGRRRARIRVPLLVALATAVCALGPAADRARPAHRPADAVGGCSAGCPASSTSSSPGSPCSPRGCWVRRWPSRCTPRCSSGRRCGPPGWSAAGLALLPLLPAALPGAPPPPIPAFFTGPAIAGSPALAAACWYCRSRGLGSPSRCAGSRRPG